LNLVKVLKGAIEHMRKDFTALGGDAHVVCFDEHLNRKAAVAALVFED